MVNPVQGGPPLGLQYFGGRFHRFPDEICQETANSLGFRISSIIEDPGILDEAEGVGGGELHSGRVRDNPMLGAYFL